MYVSPVKRPIHNFANDVKTIIWKDCTIEELLILEPFYLKIHSLSLSNKNR